MKKKLWIISLLSILLITIVGCNKEENNKVGMESAAIDKSNIVEYHYDIMYYDNVAKYSKGAKVIGLFEVVKQYPAEETNLNLTPGGRPFMQVGTVYDVKVVDSIKGKFKKDDVIKVRVSGGEYKGKIYKATDEEQFTVGKEYILALCTYDEALPYFALNGIQGVMEVENGFVKVNSKDILFKDMHGKEKRKFIEEYKSRLKSK